MMLTNIVAGHHSSGVLTVEEFERINSADELNNLINKLKQDSKIIDVYRTAN